MPTVCASVLAHSYLRPFKSHMYQTFPWMPVNTLDVLSERVVQYVKPWSTFSTHYVHILLKLICTSCTSLGHCSLQLYFIPPTGGGFYMGWVCACACEGWGCVGGSPLFLPTVSTVTHKLPHDTKYQNSSLLQLFSMQIYSFTAMIFFFSFLIFF